MVKFTKIIFLVLLMFANTELIIAQQAEISNQLDQFFQKAEKLGYSGNVLVVNKGEKILSKGYGWQDPEKKVKETDHTIFDIGSITKQFTAAAILKLEEKGKLSVQDKLSKYFPSIPEDKKEITLHQLLTHQAGFPGAIGDDYDLITAEKFIELAFATKLESAPGVNYNYSNVGYSILGILVEKLSGKKYEQFLHDELFIPSGMNQTGYLLPKFKNAELAVAYRNGKRWGTMLEHPWDADGPGWHLKANGGILSTLQDMYKWYEAIKDKKVLNEKQVFKYLNPAVKEGNSPTWYAYGWVVEPREGGDTLYNHNGGNGAFNTYVGFDLKNDQFIIVSSNTNEKISDNYALHAIKIMKGAYKASDPQLQISRKGIYKTGEGDTIQIHFDEMDQLIADFHTGGAMKILCADGTEIEAKEKTYNERTKQMLSDVFKGQYAALAKAWGAPVEDVSKNAGEFWNSLVSSLGDMKQINVIGSVARSNLNLYLTFVSVQFENGKKDIIYAWRADNLDDMQVQKNFNKVFIQQTPNAYFAASNKIKLEFKGETVLFDNGKTLAKAIKN